MAEYDPVTCAEHKKDIDDIKGDLKEVRNKLFGNGGKGVAYIVENNSIILKINSAILTVILGAIISLAFKIFGGG